MSKKEICAFKLELLKSNGTEKLKNSNDGSFLARNS